MYHFKVDVDYVEDELFIKYMRWIKYALKTDGKWQ